MLQEAEELRELRGALKAKLAQARRARDEAAFFQRQADDWDEAAETAEEEAEVLSGRLRVLELHADLPSHEFDAMLELLACGADRRQMRFGDR